MGTIDQIRNELGDGTDISRPYIVMRHDSIHEVHLACVDCGATTLQVPDDDEDKLDDLMVWSESHHCVVLPLKAKLGSA